MNEIEAKSRGTRRRGRPPKHGGYSLIHRDALLKEHPEIRRYLQDCRDGLVRDVAGTEEGLSEQQRIMIDRIISRLSICRLVETYIEKFGPFRRDRIRREKVLELEPALGVNYLAFSNSIDRALVNLGLNKRQASEALDLGRYIAAFDEKKAKEAKAQAGSQGKASGEGEKSDPG
jgi:hypothetical protein